MVRQKLEGRRVAILDEPPADRLIIREGEDRDSPVGLKGTQLDRLGEMEPQAGTMTVAEIYAAYPAINGQAVSFSGNVIKFSANIMSVNWVTLQDGTGTAPENTLVFKTLD